MAGQVVLKSMALIGVLVLAAIGSPAEAAPLTCGSVVSYLSGCLNYVTNRGPLGNCCGGVRGLYAAARTTADRQAVCKCLKGLAGSYKGINYGKAAGLPGQCKVNIPYQISPNTDCTKVR